MKRYISLLVTVAFVVALGTPVVTANPCANYEGASFDSTRTSGEHLTAVPIAASVALQAAKNETGHGGNSYASQEQESSANGGHGGEIEATGGNGGYGGKGGKATSVSVPIALAGSQGSTGEGGDGGNGGNASNKQYGTFGSGYGGHAKANGGWVDESWKSGNGGTAKANGSGGETVTKATGGKGGAGGDSGSNWIATNANASSSSKAVGGEGGDGGNGGSVKASGANGGKGGSNHTTGTNSSTGGDSGSASASNSSGPATVGNTTVTGANLSGSQQINPSVSYGRDCVAADNGAIANSGTLDNQRGILSSPNGSHNKINNNTGDVFGVLIQTNGKDRGGYGGGPSIIQNAVNNIGNTQGNAAQKTSGQLNQSSSQNFNSNGK